MRKILVYFKTYKKILILILLLLITLLIVNAINFNNIEGMKYKVDNEGAADDIKANLNATKAKNEATAKRDEETHVSRHDRL